MKFNADIHNRKSLRLKGYDYSREGLYFITICAHEMECLFGEIENGEVKLNIIGEKIKKEILKTEEVRENIEIHEWVIMPNHFHGIIEILGIEGVINNARTKQKTRNDENYFSKISPKSNTLSLIIRSYKSCVTRNINRLTNKKCTGVIHNTLSGNTICRWHRNYYENIIRNEKAYLKVTEYIRNNPVKWEEDRYYIK